MNEVGGVVRRLAECRWTKCRRVKMDLLHHYYHDYYYYLQLGVMLVVFLL